MVLGAGLVLTGAIFFFQQSRHHQAGLCLRHQCGVIAQPQNALFFPSLSDHRNLGLSTIPPKPFRQRMGATDPGRIAGILPRCFIRLHRSPVYHRRTGAPDRICLSDACSADYPDHLESSHHTDSMGGIDPDLHGDFPGDVWGHRNP